MFNMNTFIYLMILFSPFVFGQSNFINPLNYRQYAIKKNSDLLTTQAIANKCGYQIDTHYVKTTDGWILELHRIPRSRNASIIPTKVVLLPHCFFCSSSVYVIPGQRKALAFKLSENGYDVWMMNARGNSFSSNHTSLKRNSFNYWDFSWHDIGMIDVPTSLDYVLNHTGAAKVDIIGFSMGASATFVMLSHKPEYNEKIRAMAFMAPAIYIRHISSPLVMTLAPFRVLVTRLLRIWDWFFMPQRDWSLNEVFRGTCTRGDFINKLICDNMLFGIIGSTTSGVSMESMANSFDTFPDTTSTQTLAHFAQIHENGRFAEYDYGPMNNYIHYGRWTAKKYDISAVKVPVVLIASTGDRIVSSADVEHLSTEMKNVTLLPAIQDDAFGHMHFVWSRNADVLAYDPLIKYLNKLPEDFWTDGKNPNQRPSSQ